MRPSLSGRADRITADGAHLDATAPPHDGFFQKNGIALFSMLTSAVLALAGLLLNARNHRDATADACRNQALALYDKGQQFLDGDHGAAPTIAGHQAQRITMQREFLHEACDPLGNFEGKELASVLGEVSQWQPPAPTAAPPTSGTFGSAATAPDTPATPPASTGEGGAAASPVTAARAAPTIFIQIGGEAQRSNAVALARRLDGQALDGRRIRVMQGVELATAVSQTQLRCLKRVDCPQAAALAALIEKDLPGVSVAPKDFSRAYDRVGRVPQGTFELWLAPGVFADVPTTTGD